MSIADQRLLTTLVTFTSVRAVDHSPCTSTGAAAPRVLVAGAGGLGIPAIWTLMRSTEAHVEVWDPDRVERSNLHRQVLFTEAQIGQPKARSLVRSICAELPEAAPRLQACSERLDESTVDAAFDIFDLIIEATDDARCKFLVNDRAQGAAQRTLIGGLERWSAALFLVGSMEGGCFRCMYEDVPRDEAFQICAEAGILGPLAGVAGGLLGWQAAALLGGRAPRVNTLTTLEPRGAGTRGRPIPRRPGCAAHAPAHAQIASN